MNKLGNFLYKNWFLIPVGICIYGMTGHYQIALQITALLWLVVGGIMHQRLKEKDQVIEDRIKNIEDLEKIIEVKKLGE